MDDSANIKPLRVNGPYGPLSVADLPRPGPQRWTMRRKAEVVAAVRGGLLSLEEACSRYVLSPEEFSSWEQCMKRYGVAGLRTTRIQFYPTGSEQQRDLRRRRVYPDWRV
jgi:hypothetical protein